MADKKDTLELELEEILGLWDKEHGKTKNEKAEAEINFSRPESEEIENIEDAVENPDEELSDSDIDFNEQELLDIIKDQLEEEPEIESELELEMEAEEEESEPELEAEEEEPEPELEAEEEEPEPVPEVPRNIDYSVALEDFLTEKVITTKEEKKEYKSVTKKKKKKSLKNRKVLKVFITIFLLILMILIVMLGIDIIIH